MKPLGVFGLPAWWMGGAHLGRVTSVKDPDGRGRVKLKLLAQDTDGTAEIWARVAVPFAADNCGGFFIPDVEEEVLVVFVGNNADAPVVVGSLWNGKTSVPETLGGERVDRWTITGKAGTHIAIIEAASGQEKVVIETPAGVRATLTDAGGQSIKLEAGTNTLTMDTQGISLQTSGTVAIKASKLTVSAGMCDTTSGISKFSGVVKSDAVITNTIVATTYTPGAGNIW